MGSRLGKRSKLGQFKSPGNIPDNEYISEANQDGIRLSVSAPDPSIDFIKLARDLNNDISIMTESLKLHLDVLKEQDEILQQRAQINHQSIETIKNQIKRSSLAKFGIKSDVKNKSKTNRDVQSLLIQISPETTIDFLKSQPVFLQALMEPDSYEYITRMIVSLPSNCMLLFIEYSIHQLNRMSMCFKSFLFLQKSIGQEKLFSSIVEALKSIFVSDNCFLFIKDMNDGEYECSIPNQDVLFRMKDQRSIINYVAHSKEAVIIHEPNTFVGFSQEVDILFNPMKDPMLICPIGEEGIFCIIHTSRDSFSFAEEDSILAQFFAFMLQPLLKSNKGFDDLSKATKKREVVEDFERSLLQKDKFEKLLPYLDQTLKNIISNEEMKIFFVGEKEFYIMEKNGTQYLPQKIGFFGIPYFIMQTDKYIYSERIEKERYPMFNEEIDNWCLGKPFCGFPIHTSEDLCSCILCVSGKNGGSVFNEEDLEILLVICSTLSLSIQRCIENKGNQCLDNAMKDLRKFPQFLSEFDNRIFEDANISDTILIRLQKYIGVQSLSCFLLYRGEIKCLTNLIEGLSTTEHVVHISYAEQILKKGLTINVNSIDQLPGFIPLKGMKYYSIFATCLVDDNYSIVIFAINAKNQSGMLHDSHSSILHAIMRIIIDGYHLQNHKGILQNDSILNDSLSRIMSIWKSSNQSSNHLDSTLNNISTFINYESYIFYQERKLIDGYFPLVTSLRESCPLHKTDQIIMFMSTKSDQVFYIPIRDSILNEYFNHNTKCILLQIGNERSSFVLFFGDHVINAISDMYMFIPIIRSAYEEYLLRTEPNSSPISLMNSYGCIAGDIDDLLIPTLSINNFSNSEIDMIPLRVFHHYGIHTFMEIDLLVLVRFVFKLKSKIRNWTHCIDSFQFVVFMISLAHIRGYMSKERIAAILLASLSSFINVEENSVSCYSVLYGELYPHEKMRHNYALMKGEKLGIFNFIQKDDFFYYFSSCIFLNNFDSEFDSCSNNWDGSTRQQISVLLQLIMKLSSFSQYLRLDEASKSSNDMVIKQNQEHIREILIKLAKIIPSSIGSVTF